jgi:hypothetical protein
LSVAPVATFATDLGYYFIESFFASSEPATMTSFISSCGRNGFEPLLQYLQPEIRRCTR